MLFLHVCCANCLLNYLESLKKNNFDNGQEIILYFDNNNIHPKTEYQARLQALQLVCKNHQLVKNFKTKLFIANYQPQKYFQAIKVLDAKLWTEKRCELCWQMRLAQTLLEAKKNKSRLFSTTLLVSLYQNVEKITQIGNNIANKTNINFFKPKTIITNYKASGFYKQNYCGCCFSLTEKATKKFLS